MAIKKSQSNGKVTFSVSVSIQQDEQIFSIAEIEDIDSKAEVMRRAFDFYVKTNYPQLLK